MNAKESMDKVVARIDERQQAWDATLRFRINGFEAVSKRCHALASSSKPEYWRLKQEIGELLLQDLDTWLPELFGAESHKIRAELVESLKEEDLLGIFPMGKKFPDENAIDVRFQPSLGALRCHNLLKKHLIPKLKTREDCPLRVWVPMTQADMAKRNRRLEGRSRSRRG